MQTHLPTGTSFFIASYQKQIDSHFAHVSCLRHICLTEKTETWAPFSRFTLNG